MGNAWMDHHLCRYAEWGAGRAEAICIEFHCGWSSGRVLDAVACAADHQQRMRPLGDGDGFSWRTPAQIRRDWYPGCRPPVGGVNDGWAHYEPMSRRVADATADPDVAEYLAYHRGGGSLDWTAWRHRRAHPHRTASKLSGEPRRNTGPKRKAA